MISKMNEGMREGSEQMIALTESLNSNYLEEGKIVQFDPKEMLQFIVNKSDNIKYLSESFGFDYTDINSMDIDNDSQMLSIKQSNETLKVFLGESIKKNLNDFYKSL